MPSRCAAALMVAPKSDPSRNNNQLAGVRPCGTKLERAGRIWATSPIRPRLVKRDLSLSRVFGGSVSDALTIRSVRMVPISISSSILAIASSIGTSTNLSQSLATSKNAISILRRCSSRLLPLALRLTNLIPGGSLGTRPGTATISYRGTCVVSPNANEALIPAGPVPTLLTILPTISSAGGGDIPRTVGRPRQ